MKAMIATTMMTRTTATAMTGPTGNPPVAGSDCCCCWNARNCWVLRAGSSSFSAMRESVVQITKKATKWTQLDAVRWSGQ